MKGERLQKFIASTGITSRRKAEKLILDRRISVDGNVIDKLGTRVFRKNIVKLDGRVISSKRHVYYLLNKPSGYICSNRSFPNQPSVIKLIKSNIPIFSVGRLDQNTTGLLLLTNDGDFAQQIIHPKFRIIKGYRVIINGLHRDLNLYNKRIYFKDINYYVNKIKFIRYNKKLNVSVIYVFISEGKKREVKRIFKALGLSVIKLHRFSLGNLKLSNLKLGSYKEFKKEKLKKLIY